MPGWDGGRGGALRAVVIVASLAVLGGAAALWLAMNTEPGPEPASPSSPPPSPSPEPEYYLLVDLRRVDQVKVRGRAAKQEVEEAAEAVRTTLSGVYTAGFVDPDEWHGGRFPVVFEQFSAGARPEAHRDLQDLTLGSTAGRLARVRPERARVNVRVLVNAGGHPVSAVALMEFRATGVSGEGLEVPIRHDGRYVLRPFGGRWLIVAYDVRGRLGGSR